MSNSLPRKTFGDHAHLLTRMGISAIPGIGGPLLEFVNAFIVPPLERRRNEWWESLVARIEALEKENRLKIEDLIDNDEFVSAVMNATTVAIRNHEKEKIDALRNAVLNTAIGQNPSDVKSAMFLSFVDQFSVWHLLILRELSAVDAAKNGHNKGPETSVESITEVALKRISGLREQPPLPEIIVEELCRKGLLFWNGGAGLVSYIPQGTTQVTPLGKEFLKYVSAP